MYDSDGHFDTKTSLLGGLVACLTLSLVNNLKMAGGPGVAEDTDQQCGGSGAILGTTTIGPGNGRNSIGQGSNEHLVGGWGWE